MARDRKLAESDIHAEMDSIDAESEIDKSDLAHDVFADDEPKIAVLSGHQRRGRIAIKATVGGAWLLGIGVGLTVIVLAIALALSNPITLPILRIAVNVGIGLPGVFMIFPHVREYFLQTLDNIAKWFIPDPKQPVLKSKEAKLQEPSPEEPITPLSPLSTPSDEFREDEGPTIPQRQRALTFRDDGLNVPSQSLSPEEDSLKTMNDEQDRPPSARRLSISTVV